MIDNSVGGRGKGVWTADNQNVAATYFLVYSPNGRPVPAQTNPELSLQIGNFNPDGSQNTTGSPAGNNVFNLRKKAFEFVPGPVFANAVAAARTASFSVCTSFGTFGMLNWLVP